MHKDTKFKETLKQLGEREVINRLKKYVENGQIDNDTALIKHSKRDLIINTDIIAETVHFNKKTMSPEDIGWKAITSNLSDLSSSGLEEVIGFTIGLIAPPSTTWEWVDNVYLGMNKALKQYGGKLLGGDLSRGSQKILSVTAIGTIGPLNLHRSHAHPDDLLITSGPHGLSRLGLAILEEDSRLQSIYISEYLKEKAIKAHQKPLAKIDALKKLIECKPPNIAWRAAGTDSSDGLLEAIQSICISSQCQAILRKDSLPRHYDWPEGSPWDQWCLNGGEDYELIISLPENWAKEWHKVMPSSVIIGRIKEGAPKIFWETGEEINSTNYLDYQHF